MFSSLAPHHRDTLGQLFRFGVVGVGLTILYSAIYLPLAARMWPVYAVVIAFLVAVGVGFFLHSRISFRGHGKTEDHRRKVQFFVVQTFGFILNAIFAWINHDLLHWPNWCALVPAVLITPVATFVLQRLWVFA